MKDLQDLLSAVVANSVSEWDVDLAERLESYFSEISSTDFSFRIEPGKNPTSTIDFVEAALIVRDSTNIFSKKIEYLHSLVYSALAKLNGSSVDLLKPQSKSQSDADASFRLDDSYWGNEDAPFLPLDDIPEGKNIDLPADSQTESVVSSSRVGRFSSAKPLSLQEALEMSFQSSSVPIAVSGGPEEPKLRIAEYSLNPSGILEIPDVQPDLMETVRPMEEDPRPAESTVMAEEIGFGGDDLGFVGVGGDSSPVGGDVDVPVQSDRVVEMAESSTGLVHAESVATAETASRPTTRQQANSLPMASESVTPPVSRRATSLTNDWWKPLDPHSENVNVPSASFRKVTLPSEAKTLQQSGTPWKKPHTFDTCAPSEFRALYLQQIADFVSSRHSDAVSLIPLVSQDAARIVRTIRRKKLDSMPVAEVIAVAEVETDANGPVNEDAVVGIETLGFGGDFAPVVAPFDDGGFGNDDDFGDDMNAVPQLAMFGDGDQPQAMNYAGYYKRLEEDEQLAKRMAEWEAQVLPVLQEEETHKPFDIREYKSTVLQEVEDSPFAETVAEKPVYEVCRAFLTVLQLACDGNVVLSGTMDDFRVKKVSDELRDVSWAESEVFQSHIASFVPPV